MRKTLLNKGSACHSFCCGTKAFSVCLRSAMQTVASHTRVQNQQLCCMTLLHQCSSAVGLCVCHNHARKGSQGHCSLLTKIVVDYELCWNMFAADLVACQNNYRTSEQEVSGKVRFYCKLQCTVSTIFPKSLGFVSFTTCLQPGGTFQGRGF